MAMLQSAVDVAKTHEIMARFRPIAPKPALPPLSDGPSDHHSPSPSFASATAALHLRARPCRARKRGRSTLASLPSKRPRTPFFPRLLPSTTPAQLGLARGLPLLPTFSTPEKPPIKTSGDLLTLSLLPPTPSPDVDRDLVPVAPQRGIPVERDLLQKLQQPKVIVPQPVRPVGSSITIGPITLDTGPTPPAPTKKREEVEEEVESDLLPAVISDSRNQVRLANSAYKEMVGQPECPWLDSMVPVGGHRIGMRLASRRISGGVMLDLSESSVPLTSKGFSCRARIQWACNGTKTLINAPCDVRRLSCDSKDYLFTWRFHTAEASVSFCKA
ncbi:uncharacterized protein [Elaeis guineensis]|uniref:Uncharacterized protein LOC105060671 n=1 Tax=Elaeis guineensis var. tenera TaxID=51953 RepID=A0A6I9SH41_ELAGV|nr:uncharacterized protein LOC105060671 [Elaeis guineensis]